MICQWQADQLFSKAKDWGKIGLRDTDKSHFLQQPRSILVLSFNQQI